jgi:ABC-type Na+ efflux pump permease subunit
MGTESTTFLLDRKWPFRLAVGGWLAIGVGAWYVSDALDRPGQVVLAGLWLVGLGLLLRQFILSLFGPVLAFDVLRVGRKPRQIWFRVAYAVLLAVIFTWIYLAWMTFSLPHDVGSRVTRQQMSRMAESFFYTYVIVQFILVCFLTPASVAGTIAEEKERRTLEFLLATDLRDREILFGKLASRVGALLLFLMAGLPILGLLQFFGGIDPELVLAAFAATVLVVLTLSALSMAASVLSRRARDAIALTYLAAVAYTVLSLVLYGLSVAVTRSPVFNWSFDIFGYTITPEDLAYPVVCGNPLFMVGYVMERRVMGTGFDLLGALQHFALFHAFVIAALIAWSGLRLRSIALRQTFGGTAPTLLGRLTRSKKKVPAARARRAAVRVNRPDVGESPIIWKEVFVDSGLRMGGFGRVFVIVLVAFSLVPVAFIFWFTIVEPGSSQYYGTSWWSAKRWEEFGRGMNGYLRAAGTAVATLVFLAMAIRGSSAVSGERDRHTLDALLTTPMSAKAIVWGKWWGCILGMRWGWAWLFGLWVLGLATGGVHPIMFPAAVVSAAVYGGAFAWLGIYFSLHARTTLRSTMGTILACAFLGGGYFLVFLFCCVLPLEFSGARGNDLAVFVDLLKGFSPSVNMALLPIRDFEKWEWTGVRDYPYAPFWVIGLIAWGLLSVGLSNVCVKKFRQLANRGPVDPPPWRPAEPPPLPPRSSVRAPA